MADKSEKDGWDKFEIVMKIVILGLIPLVIQWSANHVSESLKKGELIQTLISDLTSDSTKKRDIALVALNHTMPISQLKTCHLLFFHCEQTGDVVVDIASALLKNAVNTETTQLETVKEIIIQRAGEQFYRQQFNAVVQQIRKSDKAISLLSPTSEQIENKAKADSAISTLQPSVTAKNANFEGIRLVYIQYDSNSNQAKEVQKYLQESISASAVPGIDQLKGIKESSIRYANPADLQLAKNLKADLESSLKITIEDKNLIDLSKAGYKVPSGQLEVWLKD